MRTQLLAFVLAIQFPLNLCQKPTIVDGAKMAIRYPPSARGTVVRITNLTNDQSMLQTVVDVQGLPTGTVLMVKMFHSQVSDVWQYDVPPTPYGPGVEQYLVDLDDAWLSETPKLEDNWIWIPVHSKRLPHECSRITFELPVKSDRVYRMTVEPFLFQWEIDYRGGSLTRIFVGSRIPISDTGPGDNSAMTDICDAGASSPYGSLYRELLFLVLSCLPDCKPDFFDHSTDQLPLLVDQQRREKEKEHQDHQAAVHAQQLQSQRLREREVEESTFMTSFLNHPFSLVPDLVRQFLSSWLLSYYMNKDVVEGVSQHQQQQNQPLPSSHSVMVAPSSVLSHSSSVSYLQRMEDSMTESELKEFREATVHKRELALERKRRTESRSQQAETEYKRVHADLFTVPIDVAFLNPAWVSAVNNGSTEALLSLMNRETNTDIWSMSVFSRDFGDKMIEELLNMQRYPKLVEAPNSMNNYGAVLDDFGFRPFFDHLIQVYLAPLTSLLFPEWGGMSLDSHHAFLIKYKIGEDESLDFHLDESQITLNACLGTTFVGGDVYFKGIRDHPSSLRGSPRRENFVFSHSRGNGILHAGQHWHGAHKIQSGERYNLILWARSSKAFRSPAELYFDLLENSSRT